MPLICKIIFIRGFPCSTGVIIPREISWLFVSSLVLPAWPGVDALFRVFTPCIQHTIKWLSRRVDRKKLFVRFPFLQSLGSSVPSFSLGPLIMLLVHSRCLLHRTSVAEHSVHVAFPVFVTSLEHQNNVKDYSQLLIICLSK